MKLLTPEIGWAATRSHLFWTTDAGRKWTDITPRSPSANEIIAAVFFLNASAGWALLAGSDSYGKTKFDLASTVDSGSNWALSQVKTSGLTPHEAILTGDGYMYFLDSTHGWINLSVASGSAFHPGAALATQDGGGNWNWVPMGSGSSGPILFATLKDGWILSPDHTELDVTHDGSKSWQPVSLRPPSWADLGTEPPSAYFLPTFEDSKHGFLIAGFPNSNPVLYTSGDGGSTWAAKRQLVLTDAAAITLARSAPIAVSISPQGSLTFTKFPPDDAASPVITAKADVSHIVGLRGVGGGRDYFDLVDDAHGWLLAGELLSTSDRGATWDDVTPPGARPAAPAETVPERPALPKGAPKPRSLAFPGIRTAPPGAPPGVQAAMGFDSGQVLCTPTMCSPQKSVNYMLAWGTDSPYLVTSLYLPSQNHTTDHNLNAGWVSGVQQQGWGLIPIWVGLQPPCACKPNTGAYPNCTLYTYLIGPDAATASTQGTTDATTAEGVAAGLVASGVAIIYKNLENYDPASVLPSGASCGSVVDAYLSSWDTKLHNDFFSAGVYGNPIPAVDWQSHVSPLPDDAWIAQYPAAGKPPAVTTWNVGTTYGMTDSMWPNYQRIHQYTNTHNEAWGGTPTFGIDNDIVNAEIVSNNGITSYTYVYSSVVCTNLDGVPFPTAVNDMNGSALITGPGETGTIVGDYTDSAGVHGFQDAAGLCSSFDVPGATTTLPTGINNLGQIVGWWQAIPGGPKYGFLKNPGKNPSTISYSGAFATQLQGINDAGQIVGVAYSSGYSPVAVFLDYGGIFYPVGSLASGTLPFGINGDATIVGYNNGGTPNFQESLLPPSWSGTVTSLNPGGGSNTQALAVNSNNEIAGNYYGSGCSDQLWCGFMWPGSVVLNVFQFPNDVVVSASGMNDFGQVVGYNDTLEGGQGFFWATQ
jgi:hypothetical protein